MRFMITRPNDNIVRFSVPHNIIVLYHLKRSSETKRSQNTISYHLERLNGTECHMLNGFVPLIRSNRTSRNAKTILFHPKRYRGTKRSLKTILFRLKRSIGTICLRKLIPYHLKRSIGTKYRAKLILSRIKRFRRTKPEQIAVRISQHIRTIIPAIVTHPQPHSCPQPHGHVHTSARPNDNGTAPQTWTRSA